MTTNQTIDGVSRELIQWLVDHEDLLDFGGREHELRAERWKRLLCSGSRWK